MRLTDALIGATAIELKATLITVDVKHFSAAQGLSFEAFEL
jgi:predicted nucleic acid-binding protein